MRISSIKKGINSGIEGGVCYIELKKIEIQNKETKIALLLKIINQLIEKVRDVHLKNQVIKLPQISNIESLEEAIIKLNAIKTAVHLEQGYPVDDDFLAQRMFLLKLFSTGLTGEKAVAKLGIISAKMAIEFENYKDLESLENTLKKIVSFLIYHLQSPVSSTDVNITEAELKIIQNDIFQQISTQIIVPILKEGFLNFKHQAMWISITDVFKFLGEQRHYIAEIVNDKSVDDMGVMSVSEFNRMRDPLDSPNYQPWNQQIIEQIENAIKENNPSTLILNLTEADLIEKLPPEYKFGILKNAKDEFNKYGESIGKATAASYHFGYLEGDKIIPKSITCVHRTYSIGDQKNCENELNNAIKIDSNNIKALDNSILSLTWEMSHSTFYSRGQSAITKIIFDGIAAAHDGKVILPDDWKAPQINYDQQALSVLEKAVFLQKNANIVLFVANSKEEKGTSIT